jgi:hypothetical protein
MVANDGFRAALPCESRTNTILLRSNGWMHFKPRTRGTEPQGDVVALQQLQDEALAIGDIGHQQQLLLVHHRFVDLRHSEARST